VQTDPRYRFGPDHGQPYSARNGAHLTLDKGIPAHELAAEANGAVQEPPPKKGVKRKKPKQPNGVEQPREPETNGDAMDLEPAQNGVHHVTDSVRADSEAAASDAESPTVAELPISTLSIGQDAEIQTEVVADLAPATIFVPQAKDITKVLQHTSWGPKESPVLLSAGKSLLQVHVIEKNSPTGVRPFVRTMDVNFELTDVSITALCWQGSFDFIVSAREERFSDLGEKMTTDKLIKFSDGGTVSTVISSTAGLVNTLRWNAESNLLLSTSTDGERGSIKVWKNDKDAFPAWTEFTETPIFDALWISDSAFVVCGIELFKIFEIDDTLTTQRNLDTQITWETLKFHAPSGIIAALGIGQQSNYLGILHPNDSLNLQIRESPDQYPFDLDFRTRPVTHNYTNGSSMPEVLLATCSLSGVARIWDANEPFNAIKLLPTTDHTQAFKIAFSPDGALLAAGGPDAVTVWDLERREVPVGCWRAKDWASDKWNPGVDGEFNLGWDPDSSRLSIALGSQVCIIATYLVS